MKIRVSVVECQKSRQGADAKSEVEHHSVCIEVLRVVTAVGVEGEVCGRGSPSEIRVHIRSPWCPISNHSRDSVISWEEPDLDGIAPFVHDEISAACLVERGTVGRAGRVGVVEGDAAP